MIRLGADALDALPKEIMRPSYTPESLGVGIRLIMTGLIIVTVITIAGGDKSQR